MTVTTTLYYCLGDILNTTTTYTGEIMRPEKLADALRDWVEARIKARTAYEALLEIDGAAEEFTEDTAHAYLRGHDDAMKERAEAGASGRDIYEVLWAAIDKMGEAVGAVTGFSSNCNTTADAVVQKIATLTARIHELEGLRDDGIDCLSKEIIRANVAEQQVCELQLQLQDMAAAPVTDTMVQAFSQKFYGHATIIPCNVDFLRESLAAAFARAKPAAIGVLGNVQYIISRDGFTSRDPIGSGWVTDSYAEAASFANKGGATVGAIVDPAHLVSLASTAPVRWVDDMDRVWHFRNVATDSSTTVTPLYLGIAQVAAMPT
jgi:hypothetical protein